MNERRYEAVWSSRNPDHIEVRELGDWINEATRGWWSTTYSDLNGERTVYMAAGYGSTPELARKACEQNRKIARSADENAIIEGM